MNTKTLLNDFAVRCFRDVADQDYIIARMSYRAGLFPQFYWSALQSVEKYLKAILLFNRVKAKDIGHNLQRAFEYAKQLPFDIKLSPSSDKFIEHLDTFGRFRYLESSFCVYGPALIELDKTIWEIRRYCRVLNYEWELSEGQTKNMLSFELDRIAKSEQEAPHKFRLLGGALEKILDTKDNPARKPLIWKNFYFGSCMRHRIKVPTYFHATNAPLWLRPEILDEVCDYVFLPKEVIKGYRELIVEQEDRNIKHPDPE